MSCVLLLAADKPLPLCSRREIRTSAHSVNGEIFTVSCESGFQVSEHRYYRSCTDELNYPMKPYQYELDIELNETDLQHLRDYLSQNFAPGKEVELWSIYISPSFEGFGICPPHYRGSLADFDMDTLEQLIPPRQPGQCWLTITI